VAGNAQVAWLSRILCVVVAHVVGFSRILCVLVAHVVGFSRMVRGAREPWQVRDVGFLQAPVARLTSQPT